MTCIPMLALNTAEAKDKAYDDHLKEFREMTILEFQSLEKKMQWLPGRSGSLIRSAYKEVYRERFHREL